MNRTVVAVVLLIGAIALGIISLIYTQNTCNSMISSLDDVLEEALTDNADEVNRLTVLANAQWEKENFLMKFFIGQKEINDITSDLKKAVYYSEIGDFESVQLFLSQSKEALYRIKESQEPDLQTIV